MSSIITKRILILTTIMLSIYLVFSTSPIVQAEDDEGDSIRNDQEVEGEIECEDGADCESSAQNVYILCREGATCVFDQNPTFSTIDMF